MFSKNIFAILQGLKAREDGKLRGHSSVAPGAGRTVVPPGGAPPGMGPPVQQQGPVYSRYDQERFRGKEGKHTNAINLEVQFKFSCHSRNGGFQN